MRCEETGMLEVLYLRSNLIIADQLYNVISYATSHKKDTLKLIKL